MDTNNELIIDINAIEKLKDELKELLILAEKKENEIIEKFNNNNKSISIDKMMMETIIENYHTFCKKIYN